MLLQATMLFEVEDEHIFKNEEGEIIDQMNLSMNGSNNPIEVKVIAMIKAAEKANVEGMRTLFSTQIVRIW